MVATQQSSVRLPQDMAQAVGSKVKSGGYNAASEVPRDGVQALPDHDAALERWLREDVVAGHEAYLADPSKSVSAGITPSALGGLTCASAGLLP